MSGTAPAPTDDLEPLYRQMLQQTLAPPAVPAPQGPTASSHEGRGWLSLLGEALGGGQEYGTTAERETGGIRALGALGQRMLAASDYSYTPHTLGSIIGQGMGAAGESLAQTGSVDAARAAALQDYQDKQQTMQLARVKEAIPILTQLQELRKQKALAGLGSPLGPAANTSIGAVGGNTYEAAIGGHEGLGADPRLPTTVGGFIPSTWQGFVAANPDLFKGMTAEQQMAARSDPKLNAAGISWLAQQNADQLTKAGVTPSGPALGVAHYIGAGAAAKALQAPDNTPVRNFVSADAVKYNPELGTMTVGQLKQKYAGVPAPGFLTAAKPGTTPPASTATVAADAKPVGDPTKPQLVPPPPGGPAGAPSVVPGVSLGAAVGAIDAGKPQYTVAPPPSGKGTPLPAGRFATSEIDPTAVSGNVEAIQAGRQRALASMQQPDGSVLAAGPAAPTGGFTAGVGSYGPTTTPPVVAAPQAPTQAQQPPPAAPVVTTGAIPRSTPDAVPDTFEEYQAQHPIVPSDEDRAGFSTAPDAAQLGVLQKQAQIAKYAMDVARTQGDAAGLAKASEAYNTILASENTIRENAGKAGADRRAAFMKDQGANQFNAWKAAQDEKQKRITQQQQNDAALKLEQERGQQTRLTNKEAVFNQANQKGLETEQTEQANAHGVVQQLEGFRSISDNVGQPGWMQTTKFPGTDQSIAERLQQAGITKLDDTAGVQLLRGGITNLVKTLRAGMPMGSLSDRDLNFIERMGPTEWMDPDTRSAAVGYLQQAYRANEQFHRDVQREMSRGKNYGDAFDAVSARQKSFVPQVPADLTAHWSDATGDWPQQRADWAERNDVRPGTLIHMDNGKIVVVKRPRANQ